MDSKIKDAIADENQNVKPDITILRNGREIRFLDSIDTELSSGDEISIFPLVAGG
ncbi:MAG: MoaD/ThiS family protein [Candidatus Thorarchaeota archaeon]